MDNARKSSPALGEDLGGGPCHLLVAALLKQKPPPHPSPKTGEGAKVPASLTLRQGLVQRPEPFSERGSGSSPEQSIRSAASLTLSQGLVQQTAPLTDQGSGSSPEQRIYLAASLNLIQGLVQPPDPLSAKGSGSSPEQRAL